MGNIFYHHLYLHHLPYPSPSTSFGSIIIISGTFFVFKIPFFICIFAFDHDIPLEIVSFYFLQPPHMMHPKDRNPFLIALFIGGKRVEGNFNTLSSLYFKGRSDVSMERVRNYIRSWESAYLFISIASYLRYAHLDYNWELDSSISRWALDVGYFREWWLCEDEYEWEE